MSETKGPDTPQKIVDDLAWMSDYMSDAAVYAQAKESVIRIQALIDSSLAANAAMLDEAVAIICKWENECNCGGLGGTCERCRESLSILAKVRVAK